MGPNFRDRAAEAFSKIVKDYPLSALAEQAKQRLTAMEQPIPEPDPVALNRQKYELENQDKAGMMSHFWGIFRKSPDVSMAAKSGAPAMETLRPTVPVTVPTTAPGGATGSDVTASPISGPSALDSQPDARRNPPQQAKPEGQDQTQPQAAPEAKPAKKSKK